MSYTGSNARGFAPGQILISSDSGSSWTDVGGTVGKSTIKILKKEKDLVFEQNGTEPVDIVRVGSAAEVMVPIGEITLANLALALPGSTLVTDGGTPSKKKVVGNQGVGMQAVRDGKCVQLRVKPYVNGVPSTDANEWFTATLAYPTGDISQDIGLDSQRSFQVTFRCLPDPNNSNVPYTFGDTTATA